MIWLITYIFISCVCSLYDITLKNLKSHFIDLIITNNWTASEGSFSGTPLMDHLLPFNLTSLHPFRQFCDHIKISNISILPLFQLFVSSWYHPFSSYPSWHSQPSIMIQHTYSNSLPFFPNKTQALVKPKSLKLLFMQPSVAREKYQWYWLF